MNVWLSVCVMVLIMVSCAPHNEPNPHRNAISSYLPLLTSSTLFRSLLLSNPQSARGGVVPINSGGRVMALGNEYCSCFSCLSAASFADT